MNPIHQPSVIPNNIIDNNPSNITNPSIIINTVDQSSSEELMTEMSPIHHVSIPSNNAMDNNPSNINVVDKSSLEELMTEMSPVHQPPIPSNNITDYNNDKNIQGKIIFNFLNYIMI